MCFLFFFFVLASHQDVGFPYMLDSRHPEDTLFLFFESDFRFYECDCLDVPTWLPLAMQASTRRSLSPASSEEADPEVTPGAPGGTASRRVSFAGPVGSFAGAERGARPQTRSDYQVSSEIRDLIEIATVAHRTGVGELVWCSWSAAHAGQAPKRSTAIAFGMNAVMFTQASARFLLTIMMAQNKPDHMDLWMLRVLKNPACSLAACYCVPPIGGFAEHHSQIYHRHGAVRPAIWRERWAQEGTRGSLSHPKKNRWLNRFCEKGVQWHAELDIPGNMKELFWATLRPPLRWYDSDPTWQEHLRARKWILPDGRWEGSVKGQGKGPAFGGSKGQTKHKNPPKEWALLAALPDGFNVGPDGTESPITRLAEQICTAIAGETEFSNETNRQKRARQWAISQYKFRYFVDDPSQVACNSRCGALNTDIHLTARGDRRAFAMDTRI